MRDHPDYGSITWHNGDPYVLIRDAFDTDGPRRMIGPPAVVYVVCIGPAVQPGDPIYSNHWGMATSRPIAGKRVGEAQTAANPGGLIVLKLTRPERNERP